MLKRLFAALLSASLVAAPAVAAEKKKEPAAARKKIEGASCKAPAVGPCAACNITCRPGETATCAPGQVFSDLCHAQPSCRCAR